MSYERHFKFMNEFRHLEQQWIRVLEWLAGEDRNESVFGQVSYDGQGSAFTLLGVRMPLRSRPVVTQHGHLMLEITLRHPDSDIKTPVAIWYTDGSMLYSGPEAVREHLLLRLSGNADGSARDNVRELFADKAIESAVFQPVSAGIA